MSKVKQPHDSGMTLPEVLISVVMTALLVATISMSITVLYKQSDNTAGRANNARSEQNVNVWMPTDLASAETVDTTPGASPCAPSCPPGGDVGGTNALMLTWSGTALGSDGAAIPTLTKVSYRYVLVGSEYQMIRVECISVNSAAPTCRTSTVLHDLDPPPIGVNYIVGQTPPSWIMVVSQALDPADITGSTPIPSDDPTFKNKNGQRVVVTINGGGDVAGAGGGKNQISLSAGGTERNTDLATNSVSFNQSLTAARTRCGGNFGLLVDTSLSISNADMATGRTAIAGTGGLIDTFAGTPVKLQVDKFSFRGVNLGAGATGSRYFDMLKESDVADLKAYINGGALSTGGSATAIVPDGSTNWEDALYHIFRNNDGTIQANLPSKVIFFTDGVPTYDRLSSGTFSGYGSQPGTTALPAPVQNPDDTGLASAGGSSYSQRAWNRANRIAREFGVQVDFIGVFVGADTTASSSWTDVNAGYHLTGWQKGYHDVWERAYHDTYQRGNNVIYQRGYHLDYQRGNNVSWQRGYHLDYQRGNNVSWQRGYHLDYQRGNNVSWQYATSGVAFEQFKSGAWTSESASNYVTNNLTPDSTDNHRVRITGTLGGWSTMTLAQYNLSNTAAGSADAFKTVTSGSASSWTSITLADYNLNNTTASDATDGFQTANLYTSPYSLWETATQTAYNAGNTTSASTDGWQTLVTGSATSWTSITLADYNLNNTTASDATDGFQIANSYTSPYSLWETATQTAYNTGNTASGSADGWQTIVTGSATSWTSITSSDYNLSNTTASDATDGFQTVNLNTSPFSLWQNSTQAAYDPANTTVDSSDGWRTTTSGSATSWATVTAAQYNASNTTTDATDGWQIVKTYSSPFVTWETTTQGTYNSNNSTSDESDGYRTYRAYTSPFSSWENTDEASYIANKTAGVDPTNTSDGWIATKVYVPPYTGYDATRTYSKANRAILGELIDPAGLVDPVKDASGNVINAELANMYSSTNWADVRDALKAIALGQCGGTLTLQTRVGGTSPANDTFTYSNTIDNTKVETSGSKRSGTFDFAIPSGGSITTEIQQQNVSSLTHYAPAGWSCKAGGVPVTPTIVDVAGTPWDTIRLNIAANQAVSCIQNVTWIP